MTGPIFFTRLSIIPAFLAISISPLQRPVTPRREIASTTASFEARSAPSVTSGSFPQKHRRQYQEEAYRSRVCSWIHLRSSVIFIRYASFLFFMIFCFNPQIRRRCHASQLCEQLCHRGICFLSLLSFVLSFTASCASLHSKISFVFP